MKTSRFAKAIVIACLLAIAGGTWTRPALAANFDDVAEVLENRCVSCHDAGTREGGIDLTPLLQVDHASYGEYTWLWIKLENKVSRGEMPPRDEGPLKPEEKETLLQWFQDSFVLREGRSHIGRTPLRRLTRYELENTLEDVLAISLQPHYRDGIADRVQASTIESIVPSDIPGESGFENDAHRMEQLKPDLHALAAAAQYALTVFSEDTTARTAVLGRAELPADAGEKEIRQAISAFLLRAYRGKRERLEEYTKAFVDQYQKHVRVSNDSNASLLHVFEMILLSPEFLYRFEETRNLDEPYPVSGIELATRLSYFLWSTAPDDELLRLGQDGSLLEDDVLKSQVSRMLNSPKRIALSEHFAGHLLGFAHLLANRVYLVNERWNRETYD